jgi:protein-S-isoprenylcysteine O-methyltransferase Ste14
MSYAVIYDLLWLLIVVYWVATAFGNKKTTYRWHPWARVLGAVVVITILALFWNTRIAQKQVFAVSDLNQAIGIPLCAAGVAFAIWARRTLGTNWSGNPTIKEGHELIKNGPYRWVRHPIYAGIFFGLLGTFVGSGRVRTLVVVVGATLCVVVKLWIEEGLMLKQFPEAYAAYRKQTKTLIPFIW